MLDNAILLLNSDVRDIVIAARDTHIFTGYLLARGYDATPSATFWALLQVRPWLQPQVAPWRLLVNF